MSVFITRRQLVKAMGMLSSLLFLEGCELIKLPDSQCPSVSPDKMRPRQIQLLTPGENSIVEALDHEVPITHGIFLEVALGSKQSNTLEFPYGVRLSLDGVDVTEKATLFSGCGQPTLSAQAIAPICGTIQYKIRDSLNAGKHRAKICFKDKGGNDFCYEWTFYADPGDGSGLRDLCPTDRVVPRQMGVWFPAHNQVILKGEDVIIDVHFAIEEIIYPSSVKLFLDNQELPIEWGTQPERAIVAILFKRISGQTLGLGKHIVKIEFQDKSGKTISYDWKFYIQVAE